MLSQLEDAKDALSGKVTYQVKADGEAAPDEIDEAKEAGQENQT
jgi:hypothetical protein